MSELRCQDISKGLRPSEVVASFQDVRGRNHYIRVERDFLSVEEGASFLPVGIVSIDSGKKLALVELPHEAETGANRLWVKLEQMRGIEVYT